MILRKCSDCKEQKSLDLFSKWNRDKLYGKKNICKVCDAERTRKYYYKNIEKEKARRKNRYLNNKEEEIKKSDIYKRAKKEREPQYKLLCNLRDRHSKAVKLAGQSKSFRSTKLLGCTASELKTYFENLFTYDMDWSNYGIIWNIDHIYPLSKVDWNNEEEVNKACHYTNLKPEYCSVNFSKGNRIY